MMWIGRRSPSRYSWSSGRIRSCGPTRYTCTGRVRQARMAPRISGSGALSAPMASRAMLVSIVAELAGFLHIEYIAALVGAALGAGPVGQLALVAVRALGNTGGGQRIMCAAFGGAGLGVAPLWIRHCRFLSCKQPAESHSRGRQRAVL